MSERDMMQRHGTTLMRLKPINLLQAAERDLALKAEKLAALVNADDRPWDCVMEADAVSRCAPYAFCSQHVRRSKTARDLLERANRDRERGCRSGKVMTRVIYEDAAILEQALALARETQDGS